MNYVPLGKHLVSGQWIGIGETFVSSSARGPASTFFKGDHGLVGKACSAAATAFLSYGSRPREERAGFLVAIAEEIEARADAISDIGSCETGLPPARLESERGRTTAQLRLAGTLGLIHGNDDAAIGPTPGNQGRRLHPVPRRRARAFDLCAVRPEPIPFFGKARFGQSHIRATQSSGDAPHRFRRRKHVLYIACIL